MARRCKGRMRCKSVCVCEFIPLSCSFVVLVNWPSEGGTREKGPIQNEDHPFNQSACQSVTPVNNRISPVQLDSLFPRAYCYPTKKKDKTQQKNTMPLFS